MSITTVNMTAPVGGERSEKLETELIPTGFQLCTLYGIADLQTQDKGEFGPKHRIGLMFEFPLQKRVFYEGDEPKASASYIETTYSMHEKANLRALVHGMAGKMSDTDAKKFNIASLLGKSFVANMTHSDDGKYANIDSLSKLNDQTKLMFGIQDVNEVERFNDFFFWAGVQGYDSDNFKGLPFFIREKIKSSSEGILHAKSGGTFAEPERNDNGGPSAPKKRKLIMLVNDYTYEQYSETWTDEALVEHGKAKWEEAVAPPAPVAAPSAPSASSAPAIPKPTPAVPVPAPKPLPKVMVMKDGSDPNDWYAAEWTDEMIIAEGHGNFQ